MNSIKELPHRTVNVPGHGEFDVPRYISRVDSGEVSPGGWHGWQVRWPGHNAYFSDVTIGGVERGLFAAIGHVVRRFPGKRSQVDPKTGVRVVTVSRKSRVNREVYVLVSHPKQGKASPKLYVGIEGAKGNGQKLKVKIAEGWALRRQLIAEHHKASGTG